MANQTTLLNPSDIRTMRKDIKQLRKLGTIIEKPKQEVKIIQKEKPTQQISQNEVVKTKEKEMIEKILGETAKERYVLEKEELIKPEVPVTKLKQDDILQQKALPQETPLKELTKQMPEIVKPTFNASPDLKAKPINATTAKKDSDLVSGRSNASREKIKTSSKTEQEIRKNFMADIEQWASEN